jgi:hypothetical protein
MDHIIQQDVARVPAFMCGTASSEHGYGSLRPGRSGHGAGMMVPERFVDGHSGASGQH